jgi:hypothetical protein
MPSPPGLSRVCGNKVVVNRDGPSAGIGRRYAGFARVEQRLCAVERLAARVPEPLPTGIRMTPFMEMISRQKKSL